MIPYARFYRAYGIRKPEFLLAPPMPSLTRLTFPFFSVYHYLGAGVGDLGPSQNDPMIAAQPTQSAIEHVDHLSLLESHPAKMPVSFQQLVRKHRALNNKFVPVKKLDQVAKNQRVLITFNYSLLDPMYRYKRMRLASKFKNQNKLTTVVNKINEVAREISHQQFLMVDLPEFLPSIAEMRTAMKVMTDDGIRKFASLDSYFILQMWLWLGRDRELSDLAKLEENAARFTNVVFRDAGRFVVVNLGELDSWRKLEKGDLQEGDADKGGTKDKITLQRGFLSMLTRMTTARTEAVSENIEEVDGPSEGEFDASVSQDQSEDPDKTGDGEATDDENALKAEEVDRDLASLDLIGAPVEDPDEEDLVDIVEETQSNPVPRPVNTGRKFGIDPRIAQARQDSRIDLPVFAENFTEVLDDVATNSTMGVSEFRKFSEQAANYAGIKAPENTNGFATLGEFATVSPKETEISTVAKVPDIGNVFDKSMLETTLLDFTNRYVENFLQRDIAGMVVSLQNAGVLVKDYQVEEVNTVTGAYYAYSVEVKPIQGQPSVMHFRVPKVNEEGQFTINSTKYYLRMQRGDLPIRKINAGRVALTSYYGKVFVDRCARKVHNYGRWLVDQVRAVGLDDTNGTLTNMIPGDVFVNDASLPRLYTTLSSEFLEFTVQEIATGEGTPGSIRYYFDANTRHQVLGLPKDSGIEKDGMIAVGLHQDGSFILMNNDGMFKAVFSAESKAYDYVALPDFPTQLRLESKNIPLDFAEVMIFGKAIPVGIVLAYYMGLSNLVKTLATPRIVPTGKRVNLQPNEWAMYFEDESWVFDRNNKMASMILGGWRDYIKSSINFPAHEFDRKNVYLPLLENKQLGARYLREMDLLKQMFVDPITNRLLVKLNEPTSWIGLLTRSCELLLTDQHPAETDTTFMRIKGYERFAGAVYGELVRGLRVHNARGNKPRYKIDHSPYAVWLAITQDASKEQVCETNPIQDLKEREAVTYTGTGGRGSRTMSKKTRIYHQSELGTISESTVDSSDVGVNIFTSANPQFNCLEGISNPYVKGVTGASSLLSTSALVSPASDQDDKLHVPSLRNECWNLP